MLSFLEYTILLEGKADDLRQQHPHLAGLSDRHLVKYGSALAKMSGLPKDNEKITSTLNAFDKHGSKLQGKLKDFSQHPSFEHVRQQLQPHVEKAESKEAETETAKSGAPVVYDNGNGLKVRHIETPEAAKGPHCKGTKWCVSSKGKTGTNFFNRYSGKEKNQMYVIHTPDNKRYAYHEGENAVARDEKNDEVGLRHLVRQYPDLQKSEHLQNSKWGAFFGNEKKEEELKQKAKSEIAGRLINDPDELVRRTVARYPEHAGKLVNDPHWKVRKEVAKHPEHAGKLVNDPDSYVRMEAARTLGSKK
jgi:putative ubiquitin-RnfH superfamily antitoxin RatB of RatAB toxin-antitoxin module